MSDPLWIPTLIPYGSFYWSLMGPFTDPLLILTDPILWFAGLHAGCGFVSGLQSLWYTDLEWSTTAACSLWIGEASTSIYFIVNSQNENLLLKHCYAVLKSHAYAVPVIWSLFYAAFVIRSRPLCYAYRWSSWSMSSGDWMQHQKCGRHRYSPKRGGPCWSHRSLKVTASDWQGPKWSPLLVLITILVYPKITNMRKYFVFVLVMAPLTEDQLDTCVHIFNLISR